MVANCKRWVGATVVAAMWALLSVAQGGAAWAADTAKVTAVVGGVTYQTGSAAAWKSAKTGTQLGSGARIRTDRRGKCEIKFPGGSLVRMPPRADLVLTSVTQNRIKLLSGQVLANAVKGSGVRIEGATATASVQGTWVLFSGEDMSVWEGTATLETPFGKQQVGDQQRAGVASAIVPLVGADGQRFGQLSAHLAGGQMTVTFRAVAPWILRRTGLSVSTAAPEQFDPDAPQYGHNNVDSRIDEHVLQIDDFEPDEPAPLYLVAWALLSRGEQATDEVVAWAQGEPMAAGGMYFPYSPTDTEAGFPWEFATGSARPWWYTIRPGVDAVSTPGTGIGVDMRDQNFSTYDALRNALFGKPTRGQLDVGVESLSAAIPGAGTGPGAIPFLWLLGAATADEPAGVGRLGKEFFGPESQLDLYGILVEGESVAGGRARTAGIYGPVYAELGGEFYTRFDGEWHGVLSEAFAVWRNGDLDITAGRQHYLEGPVNNAPLGSQFAYLTFDGVRASYQGRGFSLDALWIEDYHRRLVEPGDGSGWLGRLCAPVLGGQVGLNVLKEDDADTGVSLDFSLPAVPGVLDVYGEFGDDPWHQHIETWGVYSPWLFEEVDLDLFVEYARRGDYPNTLSAMAYKDMEGGWYGLAGFRRVQGEDSEFSIGVLKRFGSLAD